MIKHSGESSNWFLIIRLPVIYTTVWLPGIINKFTLVSTLVLGSFIIEERSTKLNLKFKESNLGPTQRDSRAENPPLGLFPCFGVAARKHLGLDILYF